MLLTKAFAAALTAAGLLFQNAIGMLDCYKPKGAIS